MVTQGANKVIFQIICLSALYFVTTCAQDKSASTLVPAITATPNVNASSLATPALHNISVTTTAAVIESSIAINVTSSSIQPSKTPTKKPTQKPSPQKEANEERRFDGLSFFGGMILGAAVCIILFFALKYYRAKQRSYHSL